MVNYKTYLICCISVLLFQSVRVSGNCVTSLKSTIDRISSKSFTSFSKKKVSSILENIVKKFDKLFAKTNFRTYARFEESITSASLEAQQVFRLLKDEEVEVAIHTPVDIRDKFVSNPRFLNQHESGASGKASIFNPRAKNLAEASFSDLTFSDYSQLPSSIKPKFGVLLPKSGHGISAAGAPYNYGRDRFVFKLDRVKDRLTLTAGDSYVNFTDTISDKYMALSKKVAQENPEKKIRDFYGTIDAAKDKDLDFSPEDIDSIYIPWKYRTLMTPYISEGVRSSNVFGLPDAFWNFRYTDPDDMNVFRLLEAKFSRNASYIEVQFWNDLDFNDVERFEFLTEPPSGEFLELLERYKITIIDNREFLKVRDKTQDDLESRVWHRGMP